MVNRIRSELLPKADALLERPMKDPDGSIPKHAGRWSALLLSLFALTLAACGGEEAPGESTEHEVAAAEAEAAEPEGAQEEEAATRRYLPDEMRRSTRAERFPHSAHVDLACRVCHEAPRGHSVHRTLECRECHRASALATRQSLPPEECMACHHSPERNIPCSSCHDAPGPRVTTQQIRLAVWGGARQRTLPFDHGRHDDVTCNSCHQQRPSMAPTRSCASCHEDHHRPDARCQSCHNQPPTDAHGVRSHLTCSGSGCHDVPDVEAMAQERAVCLVCHQAQEDHEVGRQCADCHQVRGDDALAAVWPGAHRTREEVAR